MTNIDSVSSPLHRYYSYNDDAIFNYSARNLPLIRNGKEDIVKTYLSTEGINVILLTLIKSKSRSFSKIYKQNFKYPENV